MLQTEHRRVWLMVLVLTLTLVPLTQVSAQTDVFIN
jgi:hypothetical protein